MSAPSLTSERRSAAAHEISTVLVTDAERASALAMIRSLSRQGCRVIAAGPQARCAGFYSRHAHDRLVYPSPQDDPQQTAQALAQAAARFSVDLLVPITDDVIVPLNAARDRVPARCQLAMADSSSLEQAWDKRQTFALAQQLGVPSPRSEFVADEAGALQAAHALGWPVVVKPTQSRQVRDGELCSYRVRYARGRPELIQVMRSLRGSCGALIQERVSGVGRGIEVLARRGRILAAFQHRRVREVPVSGGVSSLRESETVDPRLLASAAELIEAMNWTGLAMVEFKVGQHGPRLMEVNGRVWGSFPLPVKSGMDFPAKLLALHGGSLGDQLDTSYRSGVRCRNLMLDLRWASEVLLAKRSPDESMPPRWKAAAVAVGLLSPKNRWDTWSVADPLPAVFALENGCRRLSRKFTAGRSRSRSERRGR